MRDAGMLDDAGLAEITASVAAEVADAATFAEESPEPDASALFTDVLAPHGEDN